MPGTADQSLTERLAGLTGRPVGPVDRDRAALYVLDWLGCAMTGAQTDVGRAVTGMAGAHPFTFAGGGGAEGVAALAALGSLQEMDDVHRGALLHPGPVVIPVVLGLYAADPLAALIAGYEAMIRLGIAVGPAHYAFFHNTATCGGIGAAVAAATVAGLNRDKTVSAMGHAMSLAGGLWQCRNEPVATKHLHVAEAARRGVNAARYAGAGLAGPRFILEGPQGFFSAMAQDGVPGKVVSDSTAIWKLHEVSFKPWPACRHAHPAIDAALILRGQLGGLVPDTVEVATYADAVLFCDNPAPVTAAGARFSLQHAVAVALRDGPPALAAFEPERLAGYADLRAVVTVVQDAALTAAYPAHFGARVTVRVGADSLTAEVADAWGDPERPMDAAAVIAKYHSLAAWAGVPDDLAHRICAAALALAKGAPPADLYALMHQIA